MKCSHKVLIEAVCSPTILQIKWAYLVGVTIYFKKSIKQMKTSNKILLITAILLVLHMVGNMVMLRNACQKQIEAKIPYKQGKGK